MLIHSKTSLVDTVQSMYAAFGRGDILSLLAPMHPDIDWRINVDTSHHAANAVPLFRPFVGSTVVATFFEVIARDVEMHAFEPLTFATSGDEVFARVNMEMTVRPTGRRVRLESVHVFTFDPQGLLVRFRDYSDTLAAVAAWTTAA